MKKSDVINFGKNAMGTVFLIAAAFFVCSTLLSIKTVFADPIAPVQPQTTKTTASPRASGRTNGTVARTATARTTAASRAVSGRSTTTRPSANATTTSRAVSARSTAARPSVNATATRTVSARSPRNSRNVIARSGNNARISVVTDAMRGSSATSSYTYLTNKLYTGNYSNIVDSTTGLISADAYSNCMESYYTCMDEICTARSDTKGRCSCAGRAVSFMEAESALEKANEELINLSGQLALLISTKGKDVSSAFQLTDAEKVMNCVSWQDMKNQYGENSDQAVEWCNNHGIFFDENTPISKTNGCKQPSYCSSTGNGGNNFGFDITTINGSSSDIIASLQAWAAAKEEANSYTTTKNSDLNSAVDAIKKSLSDLNIEIAVDNDGTTTLDSLANTWGYHLFEYAHNNVCGRVLDSCFNGIYEACGTPPTVTDSNSKTHNKCMNGQTSNCPYNFNSYISVTSGGDVALNERNLAGLNSGDIKTSASCFGYSTSATSTSDPYASLRGPVADARRSIMQKYLLDANAACDVYGEGLSKIAQNIAYQKVAAQQALQQKRLEFYNEEQNQILADANSAINNFNNCISELWDCYEDMADEENWTNARIKTYCAQISQSPSCYQTMICNPSSVQFRAVIDEQDSASCNFDPYDYSENTCRNIVTIYDILNGTGASAGTSGSAAIREQCLQEALGCSDTDGKGGEGCIRSWERGKPTLSN